MLYKFTFVLILSVEVMCGQHHTKFSFDFNFNVSVFKPCGLQISIPHEHGINLVIFYVSINARTRFGKADYVETVFKKADDAWTFNRSEVILKAGDMVYFEIYLQRYDKGYFQRPSPYVVTERIQRPSSFDHPCCNEKGYCLETPSEQTPTTASTTTTNGPLATAISTSPSTTITAPDNCDIALNTILKLLSNAREELTDIKADLEIANELASVQPLYLYLSGPVVETAEPKEVVEYVLLEKLNTNQKVKSATKRGNTISFELFSFHQKLDILKRVRKYLKNSKSIVISA